MATLKSLVMLANLEAIGAAFEPSLRKSAPILTKRNKKEIQKAHGLKLFIVDGVEVYAINRKNAERKAKNL